MITGKNKGNFVFFVVILSLVWAGSLFWCGPARGQFYASQEGRLLDANNRVGSFGLNTSTRLDTLVPRANLYITGNISGGAGFQGIVPYSSPQEFQGTLGSSTLSNFRRDSVGMDQLGGGMNQPQPYLDYSRSTTGLVGGRVVSSHQAYEAMQFSGGSQIVRPRAVGYDYNLSIRPLDRNYSAMSMRGSSPLDVNLSNLPVGTANPWLSQFAGKPEEQLQDLRESRLKDRAINPLDLRVQTEVPASAMDQPRDAETGDSSGQLGIQAAGNQQGSETEQEPAAIGGVEKLLEEMQQDLSGELLESGEEVEPGDEKLGSAAGQGGGARLAGQGGGGAVGGGQGAASGFAQRTRAKFAQHMQRAETLMGQGNYYRAADAFGAAIVYDFRSGAAHLGKSRALFGAGEFMSAAFFLDRALQLDRKLAAAEVDLKKFSADEGQLAKRLADLDRWQNESGNSMLLFLNGYVKLKTGDIEQARELLNEAKKAQPKMTSVNYLLEVIKPAEKQ